MRRNPRSMSDSALAEAARKMGEVARQVGRQFQRKKGSIYSAEYEGIAARNRQLYGQALLPKAPPIGDRAALEEYYRRAQQLAGLGSVKEERARIKEQKENLEATLGIKFPKFGAKEQKALSDFLHSDEWKKVYAFGSARAMQHLSDTLASGIRLSEEGAADALRQAFENFAATEDLIITER